MIKEWNPLIVKGRIYDEYKMNIRRRNLILTSKVSKLLHYTLIYYRYLLEQNFTIPWDTLNRMYFNFSVTTVTYRRLGKLKTAIITSIFLSRLTLLLIEVFLV